MIDIQVRMHDRFSVELKIGYHVTHKQESNDFTVNMWMFIPNSLDINPTTYGKGMFYRDMKSNVRLITPVFLLREIVGGQAIPYRNLERAFRNLANSPEKGNVADYEYEIKMFMSILKSASRDEIEHILQGVGEAETAERCERYLENMTAIARAYRELRHLIDVPTVPGKVFDYYGFGDEFLSHTIQQNTLNLLRGVERGGGLKAGVADALKELAVCEVEYGKRKGFPVAETDSPTRNRDVVYRFGVLKRYISSDLFLSARVKKDGIAMEQIYLSIAAGVSMIFATAVAFSFQLKYGNFTMPLFVALVVSYMLKDRIKELMRHWFAYKLKAKYFDNKITVSIKEEPIGWIKEGIDFITDDKVPRRVMDIRSRSSLLEAENRVADEKILLFRRMVRLDSEMLHEEDRYTIAGINDILRFHLSYFTQKMDNPEVGLYTVDGDGNIEETWGDKIYYLNMVMQVKHEEQSEYKRYRLILNRLGIIEIEELH